MNTQRGTRAPRGSSPGGAAWLPLSLIAIGIVGCGDNRETQLVEILKDGDLTLLSRHRLAPAAVGGAGGAGAPAETIAAAGGAGGMFPDEAKGRWRFDDCAPDRTELRDSGAFFHTAFRSTSVGCASGFQRQGLAIDGADDHVYVPDQPDFTFERGVTAAAWVKPTTLGNVRTIFRKRDAGSSTFVLATNGRTYQFVVRLNNGRAVEASASATTNVWTHVAGTYDGTQVRLYLNGTLAARTPAAGRLAEGAGPLLMGNDANGRRLDGLLDDVFFDTIAITPAQVTALNCVPLPPSFVATPAPGPAVSAGTTVSYDVTISNNDSHFCAAAPFLFLASSNDAGLSVTPSSQLIPALAPGGTAHVTVAVSSGSDLDPDTYAVPLTVLRQADPFDSALGRLSYAVAGTLCSVQTRKELLIRDVSVVDDPVRTGPGGAWSFGRLMENIAPSAAAAPAMVESFLSSWLSDQTVNGQVIPARPAMQRLVLSSFPRLASGQLDLGRAPVRLLAIVNRIDLRDVARGHAGEGRFVFGVLDPLGNETEFTMIFEYRIPGTTAADVLDSASRWHRLGALPFPSEEYNVALQALTDRFTERNAAPGTVNGSALFQLRTNEIALGSEWQFREFHLSGETGTLAPVPLALTPGQQFNGTAILTDYINGSQAAIIAQTHTVPEIFAGQPFLAAAVGNNLGGWDAKGVDPEARQKFSVNTCNGCHSSRETGTFFLQISPRNLGQESLLSAFLQGTEVLDAGAGVIRSFNDLRRRNDDLRVLLCPDDPAPPLPTVGLALAPSAARAAASAVGAGVPVVDESALDTGRPDFVIKGINRTH